MGIEINLDDKKYTLEDFQQAISVAVNATPVFTWYSGRKIQFGGKELKYNEILLAFKAAIDSAVKTTLDKSPAPADGAASHVIDAQSQGAQIQEIYGNLQNLKDKGHESDSFFQLIYNVFRRFLPNYYREANLNELKLTITKSFTRHSEELPESDEESQLQVQTALGEVPQMSTEYSTKASAAAQLQAHQDATFFLTKNLGKIGSSVTIARPPAKIPPSQKDLPSHIDDTVFSYEFTDGVRDAIKRAGQADDHVIYIYTAASQFNGAEQTGRETNLPGEASDAYVFDNTQGPQAQLAFSRLQVETINAAANLGFNGLINALSGNEVVLKTVINGYLTPSNEKDVDDLTELLQKNASSVEYLCVKGRPEEGKRGVHLFLAAAPALGSYAGNLMKTVDKTKLYTFQYQCALNSFRAQFHQAIELAKQSPSKSVVLKTCEVGGGVFRNDPTALAEAFSDAAREFGAELKLYNVQVHVQVFRGPYNSSGEPTGIALKLGLKEGQSGDTSYLQFLQSGFAAIKGVVERCFGKSSEAQPR